MTRILIADDHAVLRKGLKQIILEEYPDATIGEAADAEELIKRATNEKWDLVICDISMPGRSGLEALKEIKQISPEFACSYYECVPGRPICIAGIKSWRFWICK